MQNIAREMNRSTRCFQKYQSRDTLILDVCMAPGGFSQYLLDSLPSSTVRGISLPPENGGHKIFLRSTGRAEVVLFDITMLKCEMEEEDRAVDIPPGHADADNFINDRPFISTKFDIALCDGQVLRTHKRPEYRENLEASRLCVSQFVFAMNRIRTGGTMIVLLHKLQLWRSFELIYTFSKFATVQLFKPAKAHRIRGSFYMVATDVNPSTTAALEAISTWKEVWRAATFDKSPSQDPPAETVMAMLSEFGESYLKMGNPIWQIQKDALEEADFTKEGNQSTSQDIGQIQLEAVKIS
jgi:23S rRNA U2552 (ribose-2'-O)-methylase RlmE/FtsJ